MTEPDAEPPAEPAPPLRRWDWRPKVRWFAAEYLVVVFGVLTAVGINAAWQARQDRAQEQAYLRQLAEDLRESERILDRYDAINEPADRATGRLARAFYQAAAPSRDSLLVWLWAANSTGTTDPVLGTAEALVATGDLGLIRDDSLRSAVTVYLQGARREVSLQRDATEQWIQNVEVAMAGVTLGEQIPVLPVPPAALDSLLRDERIPVPAERTRAPFAFDADALLASPAILRALTFMAIHKGDLAESRDRMRAGGADLLRRVEASLDR